MICIFHFIRCPVFFLSVYANWCPTDTTWRCLQTICSTPVFFLIFFLNLTEFLGYPWTSLSFSCEFSGILEEIEGDSICDLVVSALDHECHRNDVKCWTLLSAIADSQMYVANFHFPHTFPGSKLDWYHFYPSLGRFLMSKVPQNFR